MLTRHIAPLLFCTWLAYGCLHAEQGPSVTHGTINILIGSKFGLVAETDSRLSDPNGTPIDKGQKLFQIDDHTICTIADFYSDSGRSQPLLNNQYPFLTSIPGIFKYYVDRAPYSSKSSFADKVHLISQSLAFNLQLVAILHEVAGDHFSMPSSRLTVAGYDGDNLKIQQVTIRATGRTGAVDADIQAEQEVLLDEKLRYFIAGIDDIAKEMLSNSTSPHSKGSPAMELYNEVRESKSVSSLALDDISHIANKIESETSKYRRQVGDDREVAYLQGGKVTRYEPLPTTAVDSQRNFIMSWDGTEIGDRSIEPLQAGMFVERAISINVNSYEDYVVQDIDRHVFTRSIFIGTYLRYSGGGPAILDSSNIMIDCTLVLDAKVALDDPYVRIIRATFPSIKVERTQ